MDKRQARALLEEERRRLERLRTSVAADRERVAGAPEGAEDLVDEANRRVGEETDEAVARQLGNRLQALDARFPGRFTPADVLVDMAHTHKRFYPTEGRPA